MRRRANTKHQPLLGLVSTRDRVVGKPPFREHEDKKLTQALERVHLVAISRDALVTADMIVRALKGRSRTIRGWIKANLQPVNHPTGRALYIWGDVLAALRGQS